MKGAKAAPKTAPEPAAPAGLTVEISIAPKPDNCDVEIGGVMIGSSPVTTQLPDGQQVGITIRKDGYQTWERRVLVSKDMKLTPELMKLSPDQKSAD